MDLTQKIIWLKINNREINKLCNFCSTINEEQPIILQAEFSLTGEFDDLPPTEIKVTRAILDNDVDCPTCIDITLDFIHPALGYLQTTNSKFKVGIANKMRFVPFDPTRQL